MTLAAWWFFSSSGSDDGRGSSERREPSFVSIPAGHPDAKLINRIRIGDEAAFAELFHQLYATLVGYAMRSLRDSAAAEDVVQTVFVELWQRRDAFNPLSGVRPYLFAAVRYRARDWRRGSLRAARYSDLYTGESLAAYPADDASAERDERAEEVARAIASLSPRAREALTLVRDHGLSYKDAAVVMGVSVNTVKTMLTRSVAALRKVIGPLLTLVVAIQL